MAQKWQRGPGGAKALNYSGKPLDEERLRELAIRYVGRYATTRRKLKTYLVRKIRERGWGGAEAADIEKLVENFSQLGYVDDALYARSKAASLTDRGYGKRRVTQALYEAGIEEGDDREALELSEERKWEAASKYARKKRIGPFAQEQADDDKRRKQLAAFLRAGHDYTVASKFVFAEPGAVPQSEYD